MKIKWHISRLARRLGPDRSGVAAVELALTAPILVGILIPMIDLGVGAYQQMQVQSAAESGAQYALLHGYTASAISSAAENATPLAGISATSAETCNCINSGVLGAPVACGSVCGDGTTAGTFVSVTTQASYTMLVSYPGLTNPLTLSGYTIVRIQ